MKKLVVLLFALLFMSYCEKDNIQVTKSDEKYNVTIKNKDGKVIFQQDYSSSPIISNYNQSLTSIKISLGSPNSQTLFYDKENDKVSTAYENVFAVNAEKKLLVYCEGNKVAFKPIFSKGKPAFIERDYSPTASIFSAINEIIFINSEKIKISYMVGADFIDKKEIITIKDLK